MLMDFLVSSLKEREKNAQREAKLNSVSEALDKVSRLKNVHF